MSNDIYEALVGLDEKKVKQLVQEGVDSGRPAEEMMDQLQDALVEIGNRFEKEEYYVPDLIYSGSIMKDAVEVLAPKLKEKKVSAKGKIVVGTVLGDIHDIGKDLVVMLLQYSGFDVIDLGVDVDPEKFVNAVKESGAKVLGLSCLLTISFDAISKTVKAFEEAGIRDDVSIMVGGAPVTELVKDKTGCDYYGKDAVNGLKFVSKIYS